jgi:hypothetical protein
MTSGGVDLARWWSLGCGGYSAIDGDRQDAMRLEEGKKGLGWLQIREENGLGRGSPVRGGRWHLWAISNEGGGFSGARPWMRSKWRSGGVSCACVLGKRWHGSRKATKGARMLSLWPAGEEKGGGGGLVRWHHVE